MGASASRNGTLLMAVLLLGTMFLGHSEILAEEPFAPKINLAD